VHKASLRGHEPSAQPWRSLQVLPHFLASSTALTWAPPGWRYQPSGSAESWLLWHPGARCRQDLRGTAAGLPPLRTCRRVCSTHCLRLPISCCVRPNRLIFFSATSTAFSISSTCASGSPCVQQCLAAHVALQHCSRHAPAMLYFCTRRRFRPPSACGPGWSC